MLKFNVHSNTIIHNYRSVRIPVPTKLNIAMIRKLLVNYDDVQVCDYLEFGWPINHDRSIVPKHCGANYKGVNEYLAQVSNYLKKEVDRGSAIGPFDANPFNVDDRLVSIGVSPLNAISKKDTSEPRIILDLSWPKGKGINDCISTDSYLGEQITTNYPSIDELVEAIKVKGMGCLIFKKDLKKAYRQIPVDPGDVPLLGYKWHGRLYFDTSLPMGMRSSAQICQRVTCAVVHVTTVNGFRVVNYLDDFAGAETVNKAAGAYEFLGKVLSDFGLKESEEKAREPSTRMSFLGVQFDTVRSTLEVTEDRLVEIKALLEVWTRKRVMIRNELESLIGKLMFISKCVRSARVFMSRMLNGLRELPNGVSVTVDDDLRLDLRWWSSFLETFNGVVMMPMQDWSRPDSVIAVDACSTGIGGICWETNEVFHLQLPEEFLAKNLHINQLEALCVVIAVKLWHHRCSKKKILLYSDNMVTVQVFNAGKSHNAYLQECLREVAFLLCRQEAELRTVHVAGVENRVPDFLSRWHTKRSYEALFWHEMAKRCKVHVIKVIEVPPALLELNNTW